MLLLFGCLLRCFLLSLCHLIIGAAFLTQPLYAQSAKHASANDSSESLALPPPAPFDSYLTKSQVIDHQKRELADEYAYAESFALSSCDERYIEFSNKSDNVKYLIQKKLRTALPFSPSCSVSRDRIGARALLNAESLWWAGGGALRASGQVKTWTQGIFSHDVRFDLERVYPRALEDFSRDQLFRERLAVYVNARERAMSWLTFRMIGPGEDLLWAYSPNLNSIRKITGVNREDAVVGTSVALNDFLYYSRKLELLRILDVRQEKRLVPLVSSQILEVKRNESDCAVVNGGEFRRSLWSTNSVTPNLLDADFVGQQPVASRFREETLVPRDVLAITLESTNPYSSRAREVVFLDRELFIPYYSLSYDVLGRLWHMNYVVSGLAKDEKSGAVFPMIKYSMVYDHQAERASQVSFHSVKRCAVTQKYVDSFQPKSLMQK